MTSNNYLFFWDPSTSGPKKIIIIFCDINTYSEINFIMYTGQRGMFERVQDENTNIVPRVNDDRFRQPDYSKLPVIKAGDNVSDINDVLALIDNYDKKMLSYLIELHNAVGRDIINVDKFENVIQALQHINAENEYDYLNSLLHPERMKGIKIPSPIPVPSCAFQLHNTVTLSTNSLGNLALLFNPFFLYNNQLNGSTFTVQGPSSDTVQCNFISSLLVNNSNNLDGHTPSSNNGDWVTVNISQGIPSVYNQYRLVSASLVVRYIGRMDITSGVIGGAIIYDDTIFPGYNVSDPTDLTTSESLVPNTINKYANFDTAMDSFYYQERNCVQGLREIYFPLDNSFEEYKRMVNQLSELSDVGFISNTNTTQRVPKFSGNGFQQMVYVLGAPPNSSCFKVDVYCNFETLPNAEFLNYMPISLSTCNISSDLKKESISIVQKEPITDIDKEGKWYGSLKRGLFTGLKKIWKTGIPKQMLFNLAPYVLPYFKPALSLFNMFESNTLGNIDNSFMSKNKNVRDMVNNAEKDDNLQNFMLLDK